MKIKFLKAGNGDCILIQHNGYNILVDGGNDSVFLIDQVNDIFDRQQVIDLLVITHHDDDHIKGIIDLLKLVKDGRYGDKSKFIKKVIFNSPRLVLGKLRQLTTNLLSYRQAHEVEQLLIELDLDSVWEIYTENSGPILFDDLQIQVLSPTKKDIQDYSENIGAYLTSDNRCDWNSSFRILEKYIDDESQDNSLFNRSSIVLNITCEGKKILLTGDVVPKRLEQIITNLVAKNSGNLLEFDYIKLPHHGSYRSINKTIIENLKCKNFVISTNGKKHFLPNKKALLKILKFLPRDKNEPINFMFNYQEALLNLKIHSEELKDYNFMLTSNNQNYGTLIPEA